MKQYLPLLIVVVLFSGCVQNNADTVETTTTLNPLNAPNEDKHNNPADGNEKQNLYSSVKREIEVLYQQRPEYGVGDERYDTMSAQLDSFVGFVPGEELTELKRKLEALAPKKSASPNTQASLNCVNNTNPVFTADVTDTDTIKAVTPPRNEKTHSHIWIKGGKKVPVYAPVDAKLTAGSKYLEGGELNYLLFFDVSCEVEVKFDHLEELVPALAKLFPDPPKTDTRTDYLTSVELKAGDLIGYTTGTPQANNWDFGVYNEAKLNHLNGKAGYAELDWRAGCPYDYFEADKKKFYYSLFASKTGDGAPPTDFCKN
ncbi:MAG: hypothetical protein HY516_03175 [Candidatus Aenigmarchaeota archaeon]|nr:hypothetical protein [Candidatus Aenigmarchaeota archaeon]